MSFAPRATCMLLVIAAALLQVSVVERMQLFGTSVNLLAMVIVAVALLSSSAEGAGAGFVGGMVVALATGMPPGAHALMGTIVGYWAGRLGEVLVDDEHPVPPLLACGLGAFVMQAGAPFVEFLMGAQRIEVSSTLESALVGGLFSALLGVPVYAAIRRLFPERVVDAAQGGLEAGSA